MEENVEQNCWEISSTVSTLCTSQLHGTLQMNFILICAVLFQWPAILPPLSSVWKMYTPTVLRFEYVSNPTEDLLKYKLLVPSLGVRDSLSLEKAQELAFLTSSYIMLTLLV